MYLSGAPVEKDPSQKHAGMTKNGRHAGMTTHKKLIFALVTMATFFLFGAGLLIHAAERRGDQGFGVMLGRPTAVTAKVWMDNNWTLEGAVGVASSDLDIHADILYHDFSLIRNSSSLSQIFGGMLDHGEVPVYIGAGPKVLFHDDTEIGIRIPLGLSYFPNQSPWEFFMELAPVVRLAPSGGMNADYGIGARYYFEAIRPRETE